MLLFLSLSLLLMIEDTSLSFSDVMCMVDDVWAKVMCCLSISLLLREEKTQGATTTTRKTDNNSDCWV